VPGLDHVRRYKVVTHGPDYGHPFIKLVGVMLIANNVVSGDQCITPIFLGLIDILSCKASVNKI
jgi:hypothetical protein